ncbi:MAG: LamG domain-containing protein [Candidatus Pacebacteria bacterium]|nr:LamG domain-containing protein [Candidatus Paceibacterota bacterium]
MILKEYNLNKKRERGFTFIEFLVYTFLLSGILLAMGGIAVNVLSSSSNSEIVEEVTYNVRFAMQKIGAEIRNADTIVLPGRTGNMLWLRTNNENDPVLFWLEDGAIVMKVAGYPQEKITASSIVIDSLTFRNVGLPKDPGSVQITIGASYYNPQNYPEYDFSDQFISAYTLRAKNSKPSDKLLTDGLVGHWTFNEGKGLTAYDFSGNDNHGTLVGAPDWSENRFFEEDRALEFDGVGDYVEIGDTPELRPNISDLSISLWFLALNNDQIAGLVLKRQSIDPYNFVSIYIGTVTFGGVHSESKKISWWVRADTDNEVRLYTTDDIIDGNWHNVVAIRKGDNHYVYVDGESKSLTTIRKTGTGPYNINNNYPLLIGSSLVDYFNGQIDDVRIYNRALSPSEVKLLYESTKPY